MTGMTPAEIRRNAAIGRGGVFASVTRAMHVSRGELIRAIRAYDDDPGSMRDGMRAALEAIGFEVEPGPEPIPDELIAAAGRAAILDRGSAEIIVRAVLEAQAKLSAEQ